MKVGGCGDSDQAAFQDSETTLQNRLVDVAGEESNMIRWREGRVEWESGLYAEHQVERERVGRGDLAFRVQLGQSSGRMHLRVRVSSDPGLGRQTGFGLKSHTGKGSLENHKASHWS